MLTIPIIYVSQPASTDWRIPAVELAHYFVAKEVMDEAQATAQAIEQAAQAYYQNTEQECENIRTLAYQEGLEQAKQALPELQRITINDTVEWLVAEQQLEHAIIQRLVPHLQHMLAQALQEYVGEQDSTDILLRRLQQRLPQMLAEQAGTLQVSVEQYPAVTHALAGYSGLRIEACAERPPGTALLTTPFAILSIDLDAHLQAILSRLGSEPKDNSFHDQQD